MIIDFHTHVFPEKIAASTVSTLAERGKIPAFSDGTISALTEQMQRSGVDISVNLPVLTRPAQFDTILRFATEINETYRDVPNGAPRIISFAGMHPDIEDYEEKLRLVKEKGILGIKIHPDYQGTFFDDERYVRILAEAKKLDLITVTHAGLDVAYIGQPVKCTPKRIMKLLDKIGGYDKLVLAHMGGNQFFSEVYKTIAGEDVYFDTAYVLQFFSEYDFKKMAEKHGEEKILFASDSPWRALYTDKDIIKAFSLGKETEEKIFSKNSRKLLNI